MIYIFGALMFWLFLLLTSKRKLLSRAERRKRRIELIEYAGAAAICAIMAEALIKGDGEAGIYPWIVIAAVTGFYAYRIIKIRIRAKQKSA